MGIDRELEEALNEKVQKLDAVGSGQEFSNLDFIIDIPLEVSVELGRTRMLIKDL